jgi:hypothetical protein
MSRISQAALPFFRSGAIPYYSAASGKIQVKSKQKRPRTAAGPEKTVKG